MKFVLKDEFKTSNAILFLCQQYHITLLKHYKNYFIFDSHGVKEKQLNNKKKLQWSHYFNLKT